MLQVLSAPQRQPVTLFPGAHSCSMANCQYGCDVVKGQIRCQCPSPGLQLAPDGRTCVGECSHQASASRYCGVEDIGEKSSYLSQVWRYLLEENFCEPVNTILLLKPEGQEEATHRGNQVCVSSEVQQSTVFRTSGSRFL